MRARVLMCLHLLTRESRTRVCYLTCDLYCSWDLLGILLRLNCDGLLLFISVAKMNYPIGLALMHNYADFSSGHGIHVNSVVHKKADIVSNVDLILDPDLTFASPIPRSTRKLGLGL